MAKEKVTFEINKEKDFSNWYSEIVKKAELGDLRYNIKGFIVFQPWSVLAMEKMFDYLEEILQLKGHKPYWYPAVIPEKNFLMEKDHVKGFAPEVFWVTETGAGEKLEEKMALRPTSETAFYQMFSIWIRSYKDLPFKTYQRAQVFRYETKATKPFIRSREFYWIETHNAFDSRENALKQAKEDMETTKEFLWDQLAIPFIFFERPQWDKFPGAEFTFAADTLMPDGKIIQLPSTHIISQKFTKAFNVKFTNEKGEEEYCWTTCYGPAVSRIFAAMISIHGDNKGLIFPFNVASLQAVIVPIYNDKNKEKVLIEAEKVLNELRKNKIRSEIDLTDKTMGEKFYYWEMKGVPFRIDLGEKEIKEKKATVFRRDSGKKTIESISKLSEFILSEGKKQLKSLQEKTRKNFEQGIVSADSIEKAKKQLEKGKVVKAEFCGTSMDSAECAEKIEKELNASVRGTKFGENEKPTGKCIACGKKAEKVIYIAKSY
ncbi:MAG: proline--tRNA ligase [Candidatus Diapherotrites archaeon CG10_big_fil_rev_8_21_14_0_10_31_34]|nr:MAG: proline--tRNA ligase [Candidatus Diapherotrites archaeon CG10_big_fil_rev_8_21_14_0_10_31_34]